MHSDSRKRPHADDDEDRAIVKKRVLTAENGSPQPNGVASETDEPTLDNLELFRKEAIYRRMRHYSRENERSQKRIAELERRKSTCEAGFAAIVACWSQLIETIRLLVKPDDLPQVDIDTEDLFDLTRHLPEHSAPELTSVLEKSVNATRTIVTSFVRLEQQSPSRLFENQAFSDCQKAITACAAFRSQVSALQSQLQDCEKQRDHYALELATAENRYERSRSRTLQALEARKAQIRKREEKEELQQKPSSPSQSATPPPASVNGAQDMLEVDILREQIQNRENKIAELEKEVLAVRGQNAALQTQVRVSGTNVTESETYASLLLFASKLDLEYTERSKQIQPLEEEVRRLSSNLEKHDREITAATEKQIQELQTTLQKRDADNVRLREQRDQQYAELVERRHKDSVKSTSLEQLKLLAENRAERISQLELEVKKCRSHLAAYTGDKQLVLSFLHGNDANKERWEILQEQYRQAERRIAALEQTLSSNADEVQDNVKVLTETREKMLELTDEVEKYRAILGPSTSPDVAQLTRLLKEKDVELEKLRLLDLQHVEGEKSLYAELDKLSSAWEALDRQVRNKVFDLAALEERLTKNVMDKAKTENKFYAAMRDKDALEMEKKALLRNLEKQGKAVEKLVDTESSLHGQLNILEKETATQKKAIDILKDNIRHLEKLNTEWMVKTDSARRAMDESKRSYAEHHATLEAKSAQLRQLQDSLTRSMKDVERQSTKLKETATTSPDATSEVENLRSLLKCSTCRINFRSTIITKCMHTFCKECVDKRIATRQRKCPACNLTFAQSDVSQFWFQ